MMFYVDLCPQLSSSEVALLDWSVRDHWIPPPADLDWTGCCPLSQAPPEQTQRDRLTLVAERNCWPDYRSPPLRHCLGIWSPCYPHHRKALHTSKLLSGNLYHCKCTAWLHHFCLLLLTFTRAPGKVWKGRQSAYKES